MAPATAMLRRQRTFAERSGKKSFPDEKAF